MMLAYRYLLFLVIFFVVIPGSAQANNPYVPDALKPWSSWVMDGKEFLECPYLSESQWKQTSAHICAWPGTLKLDLQENGGLFQMNWFVHKASWVTLPGGGFFPLDVKDNGKKVVTGKHNGQASLRLTPGQHKITGRFDWDYLPNKLYIPARFLLLDVLLDQEKINPLRQNNFLLLKSNNNKAEVKQTQSLIVGSYWKLSDGLPLELDITFLVDLQGMPQEIDLGAYLPDGFSLTSVQSDIPISLNSKKNLIIQVSPGEWKINLHARGTGALTQFTIPNYQKPYPEEFLLSFQPQPEFRLIEMEKMIPIDANYSQLWTKWDDLPAYKVKPGDLISWKVLPGAQKIQANQLKLNRQLWLSLDGKQWSSEDSISGTMYRDWRIDLQGPLHMTRASLEGEPMLISASNNSDGEGVEIREQDVELNIGTQSNDSRFTLPVHGYSQTLQNVSTQLFLPPGYRLIAAPETDHASQTWIGNWNVLNLFLITLATAIFWRLGGTLWGGIALIYFVLGYQEAAPFYPLVLLGIIALISKHFKHSPKWLKIAQAIGLLIMLVATIPYAFQQIRAIVHQQLDPGHGVHLNYNASQALILARKPVPVAEQDKMYSQAPKVQSTMAQAEYTELKTAGVTGSRTRKTDLFPVPNEIVVQAGRAKPQWSTNPIKLEWNAPSNQTQQVSLWILTPWMMVILRVVILLSLLLLIMKTSVQKLKLPKAVSFLSLSCLLLFSSQLYAQALPDQALLNDLQQRLGKAPECAPSCVTIPSLSVTLNQDVITLNYLINSQTDSAVKLPVPTTFKELLIKLDGSKTQQVLGFGQNFALLPVEHGMHRISMQARVNADQISLVFPTRPGNIRTQLKGWTAKGVDNTQLKSKQLSFTRTFIKHPSSAQNKQTNNTPKTIQADDFVRIERNLIFTSQWDVRISFHVISPAKGVVHVEYPLLPGEQISDPRAKINNHIMAVDLNAGEEFSLYSKLKQSPTILLKAAKQNQYMESWSFSTGQTWHLNFSNPDNNPVYQSSTSPIEFNPRPGQQLAVRAHQPVALTGPSIRFDQIDINHQQGQRQSHTQLNFKLEATRTGSAELHIPVDATIESITLDQQETRIRPVNGQINLPVNVGSHQVAINWKQKQLPEFDSASPAIDLGQDASNVKTRFELPENRWVLFVSGAGLGPIILYWPQLIALGLLALLLGKFAYTPLKTHHWLLLGMGFSTYDWRAYTLAIIWFHVIAWRSKQNAKPNWFNAQQAALTLFSIVFVVTLFSAIPNGLLAYPNMRIGGVLGSGLLWFNDLSAAQLPQVHIYSVPLWVYRGLMLLWALWLALKIMDWAPWSIKSLSKNGFWNKVQFRKKAQDKKQKNYQFEQEPDK
ncbi:MAG: hypothetical protein ACWA5R_02425 [bacterium]